MAKNKVEVDVEVDDKGTTKKMGLEMKKSSDQMKNLGNNARTVDRNIKGVANTSSSTTKNFSKMAQGTGGLVGAYATLAANVFAITAAFNFLKSAGDLAALQRGQEAYAVKTGQSLTLLSSRIQSATGDIVDFQTASQAAAIGRAAGLTSDQLTGLAKIAKNASVALGRDLTDSFNRLTRGAIKAEPELLDELGIVLRLETATQKYAAGLDKSAKDLTTFEKTQAVVNEVLEQGNAKFDDVGDNVNQVARLGKAFDDLLKSVKTAFEPIASFAAEVLADNVKALAAAFGILGLSISKAMIPAGPSMTSISDMAENSKKALQDAAGPGKVGQKIAGGDFSEANLRAIDKGAGAKKSTVVNQLKMDRAEFKRHTAIIRAEHARMTAANTTGIKKYTMQAKAYFLGMQAEHGKVMGTMKAVTAGFASAASKALNAIAFLGILSLAVTMIKELMEAAKDPALKRLEDNAKRTTDAFKEQNATIGDLARGFKEAGTGAETLVKRANLLSNFSFEGVQETANALQAATATDVRGRPDRRNRTRTKTVSVAGNEAFMSTIDEQIKSFELLNSIIDEHGLALTATGETQSNVEKQTALLNQITKDKAIIEKGAEGNTEAYNAAQERLSANLIEASKNGMTMASSLTAQENALKGIANSAEAFDKFATSQKRASTAYDQLINFNEQFLDSVATLQDQDALGGTFFTPAQLSAIATQLPGITAEQLKQKSVAEIQTKLRKRNNTLLEDSEKIALKALETEESFLKNSLGKNKVELETLKAQNAENKLLDKIGQKQAEINVAKDTGVDKDSAGFKVKQQELKVLQAQVALAKTAKELSEATAGARQILFENERKQFDLGIGKQLLDLDQKRLDILKERNDLLEKEARREMNRTLRTQERSPFGFINKDLRKARAERDLFFGKGGTTTVGGVKGISADEESLMNRQAQLIIQERDIKIQTIQMEFALLEAQMEKQRMDILIMRSKALQEGDDQRVSDLEMLAFKLGNAQDQLGKIQSSAIENTKKAAISRLKDLIDTGRTLKDAVEDATDLKKIGDEIAQGFATQMASAFTAIVDGTKSAKDAFMDMGQAMLKMITQLVMEMIVLSTLKSFMPKFFKDGGIAKPPEAMYGGVYSKGKQMSTGGIARGPRSGYPAILHGTEAVVPLPKGRSIPVEMKGGGGQVNNINVSVNVDSSGNADVKTDRKEGEGFANAISAAVKRELINQKRHGGMLSPYGVA